MHKTATENGTVPAHRDGVLGVHEKSPQDVLGDVTKTDLPRNVVLAAGITFGMMAILTIGPYAVRKIAPKSEKTAEAAPPENDSKPATPAKVETATKEKGKTADPLSTVPDPLTPTTATKSPTPRDPVLDKLDIGQTKSTDPKKNPLDKTNDDLLKDIK